MSAGEVCAVGDLHAVDDLKNSDLAQHEEV
jgi:hypothetical protein